MGWTKLKLRFLFWLAANVFGFTFCTIYSPGEEDEAPVLAVHFARDEACFERSIEEWRSGP